MSILFSPDGSLNVSRDASDLDERSSERSIYSGEMVRCKNMRLNQRGQAVVRDGSAKINASAIEAAIWWIEEQEGTRYSFAGTQIYEDESSIASGLTSAQWVAIQYNAFNDSTKNIFALNGIDRKRVEGSSVYEWGIAKPATKPTVFRGGGSGLTGKYNARYTYARKIDGALIAEGNPSDPAEIDVDLTDGSLGVSVDEAPTDGQVTHVRLYRTQADGGAYYLDQEIPVDDIYDFGHAFPWEESNYLAGTAFKYTISDSTNSTENTYSWEETFSADNTHTPDPPIQVSDEDETFEEVYWDTPYERTED